jgi:ABC-2 type transport system ATP-binding protein
LRAAGGGRQAVSPEPLLAASGITKGFGRKVVLHDVGFVVGPGECVGLVGENGAGKSTLLQICAGLLSPDAGELSVGGSIGYCPQEPGLFDLLTADEHLVVFGRAHNLSRRAALEQGRAVLAGIGFPVGDRSVSRELSGGARQKLNLALAVLAGPDILLLDEPYQGFDHGSYVNFWADVDRWKYDGCAVVVVTHLLAESGRVDRVVELAAPTPRARP